ncbi:hypothetical protein IXO621_19930 [Xanthomonas oryzae pv. oryzae]|nr:hypothetical protein IXO141_11765 [Xanthomonas oryzae pv. oryzae]OLI91601.1 hypothetical protein IXO390_16175 [Xanthomonas oryzae pv. oryzae]OLK16614.1 hypothetical protein IXO621_19930 [Xanthomonas oryzae pv. oryzae]OLK47853.1 hypothetical protein IXO620_02395 [Xanthomonas oryzae pv. oryzae]
MRIGQFIQKARAAVGPVGVLLCQLRRFGKRLPLRLYLLDQLPLQREQVTERLAGFEADPPGAGETPVHGEGVRAPVGFHHAA